MTERQGDNDGGIRNLLCRANEHLGKMMSSEGSPDLWWNLLLRKEKMMDSTERSASLPWFGERWIGRTT